ncbi:NAD(P)-binding protein [Hypoxylon cercidicola]|nr:NAD(P)-binding protein [Hypoxylon cercidicola]
MAPTTVLITGANRGIGKGLLQLYLARPNHTIIAANRDPDHPSSRALAELPKAEGTSLILVKIDAAVHTDPSDAVKSLKSQGIDHIDIAIANAGIRLSGPMVRDVDADEIQKHVVVNVYGLIWLFQAFRPLLMEAKAPTWVTIGSSAAFLTNMIPIHNAAYGPTKLMGHWYTKAMHIEEPWLTAFPIHPGWVQTNLGGQEAPVTVEESSAGMIKVIDAANRQSHSGKLWSYTDDEMSW